MASSNAGTSLGSEYQVFLNFRGTDTRTGFTDFLYHSLTNAGICVFRDNEELRVGERIGELLQQAINKSWIYIPVFSKNYASSQWCLDELVQIVANTSKLECNKEILPIFFDVEPNDVKLKTQLYCDDIQKLKCKKKLKDEQVNAWREALMEIDAIKGWEVKKHTDHGELIKLVVEEVLEKLKIKHRLVTEHLVGIDDRVVVVSELIDINSSGVRLIQIHGMGGIGKTTLAKVVFNRFSSHFGKYCCFLENVRAKSSRADGLVELQKKLLHEIGVHAGTRSIDESDYGMKRTGEVLCNKKVLIVLDDVDDCEQVEKLVGKSTLYSGSRILITTRKKHVLQNNRLKYQILDYEMEVMSTDHALELFNRHAFRGDSPLDDFNDLSRGIVFSTGGLPLALEVIGSFLYGKMLELWKETLRKLKKAPHEDVFGKLKISYDALTFEQQQIFLDIACFFVGEDKTNVLYMWEDCKLFPNTAIDVLISMSLVKIVKNNKFWMHDQLRDFGREFVHRENPMNPGERSRIWIDEEVLDAMRTTEMKRNVQAVDCDLRKSYLKNVIENEEIGRFEHLKYLKLNWGTFIGNLANCLTELRWMSWSYPPLTSMPANMHLKNVVILEFLHNDYIDDSKLQSLIKMAIKLKVLSLMYCDRIIKAPNFFRCPNLERLNFDHCSNLREIDGSIGKLKCLIDLRIYGCFVLEDLPHEIGDLVNLKYLDVQWCKVKKLPDSVWKLKSLRKVYFMSMLGNLDLANSWELPSAIGMLHKLEVLRVNNHYLKGQLPFGIGSLPFLTMLDLSSTHVSEVPKTISMLPCLKVLDLKGCDHIQELPILPTSLTHLLVSSASLQIVPDLSNLTNLDVLVLDNLRGDKVCTGELWWIGRLSKLTLLRLGLRNVPTPSELASLPLLNELHLSGLDQQTFPQLPLCLQELGLHNFNSILSLSPNLRKLSRLELWDSPMQEFQLDGLLLPNIRTLRVVICDTLERFKLSSMRKLKEIFVNGCLNLVEIQFSWFESLEEFSINGCKSLGRLVYVGEAGQDNNDSANKLINCEGRLILPLKAFNKLQSFTLGHSDKMLEIQILDTSESLEYFHLHRCPYVQSLGGLSNLKNLKFLNIEENKQLRVVKGLDELEFLEELKVCRCGSLERLINGSGTKLPNDCRIDISGCRKDFRGFLESYKNRKELKQRRMLGRVSLLLKIGVAAGLSALFLSKALAMKRK